MAIQNERIAQRIKELDLSLSDVAKISGLSKSTIHRYASGERESIPVSSIEALAPALHTSSSYLMGWIDDPERKEFASETESELWQRISSDPKLLELVRWMAGLDKNALDRFEKILELVEGLPRESAPPVDH